MIVENMPNEEYHSKVEFLSASNIKTLLKNPYEFLHPKEVGDKTQSNYNLGSAIHSLILEPHKFNEEFAVAPSVNLRTKAGKEELAKFKEENQDKIILKADQYEQAKEMSDAVLKLDEIKNILQTKGIAECSFFGELDGYKVKCRPDYYIEDLGIVIDVKTTSDASPDGFSKAVANFGYYIQASFYLDVLKSLGKKAEKFYFIAIEKDAPYMVGLYELDQVALDFGVSEYKRAFKIFDDLDEFASKNIYKDTETKEIVQTITLPNYVFYQKNASY